MYEDHRSATRQASGANIWQLPDIWEDITYDRSFSRREAESEFEYRNGATESSQAYGKAHDSNAALLQLRCRCQCSFTADADATSLQMQCSFTADANAASPQTPMQLHCIFHECSFNSPFTSFGSTSTNSDNNARYSFEKCTLPIDLGARGGVAAVPIDQCKDQFNRARCSACVNKSVCNLTSKSTRRVGRVSATQLCLSTSVLLPS